AAAGDEERLAQFPDTLILPADPAAQALLTLARTAPQARIVIGELDRLLSRNAGREAVRFWAEHKELLAGRVSGAKRYSQIKAWQARNQSCDALNKLVGEHADESVLAAAWQQLQSLGGHPDAEPYRQRLSHLAERETAWSEFQALRGSPNAENDDRLL